jgi:hypothetical protein
MTWLLPILFAAAIVQAAPAARADFSGRWVLDPARSETLQAGGQIERSVVVSQNGGSFQITPSAAGQQMVTYPIVEPAARGGASAPGRSAYWEGPALVTEVQGIVSGKSVIIKQTRTLDPSGSEMLVDTTVAIEHGYAPGEPLPQSSARDVYLRVAP